MPGKTLAFYLGVVQHTKASFHMGIWARRERPKELTAYFFFFWRHFLCFPKHEECCWELGPRNRSFSSIHLSRKQEFMGKVLHCIFPARKKTRVMDSLFQTHKHQQQSKELFLKAAYFCRLLMFNQLITWNKSLIGIITKLCKYSFVDFLQLEDQMDLYGMTKPCKSSVLLLIKPFQGQVD